MKSVEREAARQRLLAELAEKREDSAAVANLRKQWVEELGGGDDEFDAALDSLNGEPTP